MIAASCNLNAALDIIALCANTMIDVCPNQGHNTSRLDLGIHCNVHVYGNQFVVRDGSDDSYSQ